MFHRCHGHQLRKVPWCLWWCFNWNYKMCTYRNCRRHHVCQECSGNVPYVDCAATDIAPANHGFSREFQFWLFYMHSHKDKCFLYMILCHVYRRIDIWSRGNLEQEEQWNWPLTLAHKEKVYTEAYRRLYTEPLSNYWVIKQAIKDTGRDSNG